MAGEKILVADDAPDIVGLCERVLSRKGYAVRGVTSGQEAIARLEAEPFDLLVVDIKMPDVDGLTVLRRGRAIDPRLTAVVITGHTTLENAIATLHAGAHGLVLKPFRGTELISAVRDALSQRNAEQEQQRLRAQLPILEIAQALATEGDPGLLAKRLLEPVAREVPADRAVLLLLAESRNELTVAGAIGLPLPDHGSDSWRVPLSGEAAARLQAGSEPLLLEGVANLDPPLQALLHLPEATSIVWLPLRTLKRCVGALGLVRSAGRAPFTPSELNLLAIVGGQIAAAIENARLYEVIARGKREWEETFDAIADGISIHDTAYRFVRANQALARRLGTTVQDLIGQLCYEAVHRLSSPPPYCPMAAALASDQPQEVEMEEAGLDGIFQCLVYPLHDEQGHNRGAVHVLRNVTARRRAERALRKSEARYRALVESSSDQIFLLNREGIYLTSNDRVHHLGLENGAALVGRQLRDVYPPKTAELCQQRLEEVLATDRAVDFEHSLPGPDGERYHLDTLYPIYQDGRIWTVGGISRDITARKQTEEELRHRNVELTALNTIATTVGQSLDLDHILNATLDKVLEVLEMDGGWIQLLDEAGSTLQVAAHRHIPAEMDREAGTMRLGEGLGSQVVQSGEPIVARRDSPELPLGEALVGGVEVLALVPILAKDRVLGVLGVFSCARRELAPGHAQILGAIGHQLGVAVEDARLAQQAAEIQILREVDHLRSELIANVSHEMRTPLGLIKILSTTLLREDLSLDSATQRELLADIADETGKLEKIVDNLLDLSRLEEKRLLLRKEPMDLRRLAQEVIATMQAQTSQHRLTEDFPVEPLVVEADPRRIEQVLCNLLDNAIKYSPAGGTITVEGQQKGQEIVVRVSDRGIGIPASDLERVFERFYRVENELTMRQRGAGLGLAVCQGIVEAHGGRIWAESTPGVGSTFTFTLPVGGQTGPL
jgi:PAS domain S-box-containing protein